MSRPRGIFWTVAIASLILVFASPAFAQQATETAPAPDAATAAQSDSDSMEIPTALQGETRKHKGIHARMSVGSGFSYFSTDFPDSSFSLMGVSIVPELRLGMALDGAENLIISGGLSGIFMVEPTLDADQAGLSTSSDGGMTAVNAGFDLTYFFMPTNIFIGGNVNISYATFTIDEKSVGVTAYEGIGKHRLGFAAGFQFGKIWWVSEHTSVGLALNYIFNIYPRDFGGEQEKELGTDSVLWMGHTAGLSFTATYN